jgi:hypothetical protein
VAASVQGASHEKSGLPCQDAHDFAVLPGGVLVAAVADGAGSAAFAEVGASAAARAAVETLRRSKLPSPGEEAGWHALLREALHLAQTAVEAEAARLDAPLRELATTLIALVATPERVAVLQVGDGATVLGAAAGAVFALTAPEPGEYINETTFLVAPDAVETARFSLWRGQAAHLAVFTDGLQHLALKLPEGTAHAPFFTPLFRFASEAIGEAEAQAQLTAFLRSPRLTGRADDDLTLLLASLAPHPQPTARAVCSETIRDGSGDPPRTEGGER